jgi:type IV pilus assembly protein PilC
VATRTGRLGPALEELLAYQRMAREAVGNVWSGVAYPLVVLGLALLLLTVVPLTIVPEFKRIFAEFGTDLPVATQAVVMISDTMVWLIIGPGRWIVLAVFLAGGLMLALPPLLGSPGGLRVVSQALPLVGVLGQWLGAAAWCRLLAVLVDHGVPLAEALRLAGEGVRDAGLRELSRQFSAGVERGESLADLLAAAPRLPASLVPLVRWGEKTHTLGDALRSAADLFLERIRLRSMLLRSISPPLVFILVAAVVGFVVMSLFLPLLSLIQGLA